jgi:hypothetical protein
MSTPTFIGIGATKAGTTTVYKFLKLHPEVFIVPQKQLKWFEKKTITKDEYENHFDNTYKERGEITASYCHLISDIVHHYPYIKIIYCVRNPVDRFISNIRMMRHLEPSETIYFDIDKIIQTEHWILKKGNYMNKIQELERNHVNYHLINFVDLINNQSKVWNQLCKFLGVLELSTEYIHMHNSDSLTQETLTLEQYTNTNYAKIYPKVHITDNQKQMLDEYYRESNSNLKQMGIIF